MEVISLATNVLSGSILLKKCFRGGERNFLGVLMRFMRDDVGGYVVSEKNDYGDSYRLCEALHSWSPPKIKFGEIFEDVRFFRLFQQCQGKADALTGDSRGSP